MAVAVHVEPRIGKSYVLHRPQACNAVAHVKCVRHVNEEKILFLLLVPFSKEGAGGVVYTLNPSLEAGAELAPSTFKTYLVSSQRNISPIPIG